VCASTFAVLTTAGAALATPSFGTSQTIVAHAVYGDIDAHAKRRGWHAFLDVDGMSDVFVRNNSAIPGGQTGWHSHPGLSIVSVTQGAVSNYDGDDPSCTPTIITAGHGFVEPGDHVHLLRNEGAVEALWTTTAILPVNAAGRIDQPDPGHCPF
jgi:quercetin dioxygenase-like cupin family protein